MRYWPEKGKSGFLVWRYLLRRDDTEPGPWTKEGKDRIKKLGLTMQVCPGWACRLLPGGPALCSVGPSGASCDTAQALGLACLEPCLPGRSLGTVGACLLGRKLSGVSVTSSDFWVPSWSPLAGHTPRIL